MIRRYIPVLGTSSTNQNTSHIISSGVIRFTFFVLKIASTSTRVNNVMFFPKNLSHYNIFFLVVGTCVTYGYEHLFRRKAVTSSRHFRGRGGRRGRRGGSDGRCCRGRWRWGRGSWGGGRGGGGGRGRRRGRGGGRRRSRCGGHFVLLCIKTTITIPCIGRLNTMQSAFIWYEIFGLKCATCVNERDCDWY